MDGGFLSRRLRGSLIFSTGCCQICSVALRTGSEIELWADAYSVEEGQYVFCVLVDANHEEQLDVRVCARSVPPTDRVIIAVAISVPEVRRMIRAQRKRA